MNNNGLSLNLTDEKQGTALIDEGFFTAPRQILEMYQKMSLPSFKIWAALLSDSESKKYPVNNTEIPIGEIWRSLGTRWSYSRLEEKLLELQTTIITKNEYILNSKQTVQESFQALGPTKVTHDDESNVVALEYRILKELIEVLQNTPLEEKYRIELNMFTSLSGDKGANAAKNLILLCLPYVSNGRTQIIGIEELKRFMNLSDQYINEKTGATDFRYFNRSVITPAVETLNNNPHINFSITDVETIKKGRRIDKLVFVLEEKESFNIAIGTLESDDSSPLDPNQLTQILKNYWNQYFVDPKTSYSGDVLFNILKQFRLVDKFANEFLTQYKFVEQPQLATNQILCISTAIYQQWIDGYFSKENSKIYNYAATCFRTPKSKHIESLIKKFLKESKIDPEQKKSHEENEERRELLLKHARRLNRYFNAYKRARWEQALTLFVNTDEGIAVKDTQFLKLAKQNKFGIWAQKAVLDIHDVKTPLYEVLTRNTLGAYKSWLINQATIHGVLSQESVENFIICYPDASRDLTFLNIRKDLAMYQFEALIKEMIAQNK